ncbi:MAG: hypothetical protein Q8P95_00710 [bacterium]|nr:hypothetical protein [bacterium]
MLIPDAYRSYNDRIGAAKRAGIIRRGGKVSRELGPYWDIHAPHPDLIINPQCQFGALKEANTRHLPAVAADLLRVFCRQRDTRFLEIGHGAGVACSDAYDIGQASSHRLHITAVSMYGIDPWTKIRADIGEIRERLEKAAHPDGRESRLSPEILEEIQWIRDRAPLDLVLYADQLEELGIVEVLGLDGPPLIDLQLEGRFPYEIDLSGQTFDLVYDGNAALRHNELWRFAETLREELKLVAPEGILYFIPFWKDSHQMIIEPEWSEIFSEPVIVLADNDDDKKEDGCLVVRRDSQLGSQILEFFEGEIRDMGVTLIPNMIERVQQLLVGAGPVMHSD